METAPVQIELSYRDLAGGGTPAVGTVEVPLPDDSVAEGAVEGGEQLGSIPPAELVSREAGAAALGAGEGGGGWRSGGGIIGRGGGSL